MGAIPTYCGTAAGNTVVVFCLFFVIKLNVYIK